MIVVGAGLLLSTVLTGERAWASGDQLPLAVSITPQAGSERVLPDQPVLVAAIGGTLQTVSVSVKGVPVAGRFSADRSQWRTDRPLRPGVTYTVTAVAADRSGKREQREAVFSTQPAKETFKIEDVTPSLGEPVGVGMPIMVKFDKEIVNQAEVERALTLEMSKPVEGAWHWIDNQNVHFRPKEYWPERNRIRLVAQLNGVSGGKDLYGSRDLAVDIKIGRSQISTINLRTHHMTVKRGGRKIRSIPISGGRGGLYKYTTTSGIHLAMERNGHVVMTSPDAGPGQAGYYRLDVYNAIRISSSGEYVHGAPWSVGSQGYANVSHGCVNASPSNAKWLLDNTLIGDPIVITGSSRRLEHMNGWAQWEIPWRKWVAGSAFKSSLQPDNALESPASGTNQAAAAPS
ncbi:L,D-transpeptidase [Rhizohabitans arisaemae]|uniref:L,D-transpeptidase n=1 Tax=Rhizohabitans arisaemae TaxID=2720610 RepID=UPI0024B0A051|nr:Ig-like domain-containing protein [Rhizohabitans arisaemae]